MNKRIEKITEIKDGCFLDIEVPALDLFKVKLSHKIESVKKIKTGEVQSMTNDYLIEIDRSSFTRASHQEIASNLQQLFGMSWTSFNWSTNTFNYYTSKYTGDENFKRQQLLNIFDFLKDYELSYITKNSASIESFNKEKATFEPYKDEEIVAKYHEGLDAVVVLAISFLGKDKYAILANASKEKGYFNDISIDKEFFTELYTNKNITKKMYFVVNAYDYAKVKDLIEKKKEEKIIFVNKQEQYIETNKKTFIEHDEKNIFDFKIKFNEERKGFEFFCKGYHEPEPNYFGNYTPRGILAKWALNFILSEKLNQQNIEQQSINQQEHIELPPTHSLCNDIDLENHYRINLDVQKDSSLREKNLFVPADNWDMLKRVYDRFLEVNSMFNRPEKTIKINDASFLSRGSANVRLDNCPAIYLDAKGNATFVYQYRNVSGRTSKKDPEKTSQGYTAMKGIDISFKEVQEFFTNHPFAEQIKNNSIFLNTEIWVRDSQNIQISEDERLEAFNNIYMHAKINNEAKAIRKEKVHKI